MIRKMTREQQISAAVKQLGARGREAVETALVEIEFLDNQHKQRTERQVKKFKPALRSLLSALRKAQQARAKLPWDIQTFELELVELENYEKQTAQLLEATPPGTPKRDELRKRLAARAARDLLRRHGYTPTLTKDKKWRSLAAALYGGDPDADFLRICRDVKSSDTNRVRK